MHCHGQAMTAMELDDAMTRRGEMLQRAGMNDTRALHLNTT